MNDAKTTLGSRITNAENTATGAASAVSGLTTRVESLEEGGYISESSLVSAIKNNKDEIISEAGLVNTAALNSATAGLVASSTLNDYTKKAEVVATINNSGSAVKINADKINIDANHQLDLRAQNIKLAADKVTFTNADGTVTDKISIDPTAGTLKATNADLSGKITATTGLIGAFSISDDKLIGYDGESASPTVMVAKTSGSNMLKTIIDPDGFRTETDRKGVVQDPVVANSINSDGSGFLAKGNFSWDASGNVELNGKATITEGYVGGWSIGTNTISAGANSAYLMLDKTIPSVYAKRMSDSATAELNSDGFVTKKGSSGTQTVTTNKIGIDGSGFLAGGNFSWDASGNISVNDSITLQNDDNSTKVVLDSASGLTSKGDFTIQAPAAKLLGGAQNGDNFTGLSAVKCEQANVDISSNGGISASCPGTFTASCGQGIELTGNGAYVNIGNGSTTIQGSSNVSVSTQGSFYSSVALTVTSDERKKTIVDNPEASIEDIAEARVVDYYLNSDEDKHTHLGSIAQDWQKIYPHAVVEDAEGYLGLDYSSVALASAVTAAKEIVRLKEENEQLKQRLAAIESKLNM